MFTRTDEKRITSPDFLLEMKVGWGPDRQVIGGTWEATIANIMETRLPYPVWVRDCAQEIPWTHLEKWVAARHRGGGRVDPCQVYREEEFLSLNPSLSGIRRGVQGWNVRTGYRTIYPETAYDKEGRKFSRIGGLWVSTLFVSASARSYVVPRRADEVPRY